MALAGALILLAVSAKIGEAALAARSTASAFLFLAAAAVGTVSGYRLVRTAFRMGRRRQGRDPEPAPAGILRFLGGVAGFWIKLIVGFALWALLLQFFKRAY